MFSVIIQSEGGLKKSIREWPTVDVFEVGSEVFKDLMKGELERLKSMLPPAVAEDLSQRYKAVLKSVCGQYDYYLTHEEQAFITNSSGKTIATVR